ncbi:MAG: PAS domain-containing protein [Candidatus Eisenbacteria bacterium]|nr:PAS domain-containing protein [Candidatus Eisenbacteria bacterium]
MTLRVKILLGFGGTLLLLAVTLTWAVANLVSLGKASEAILRENYKSILAAEHMVESIESQNGATFMVLHGREADGNQTFRQNETQFLLWLGRARDNITIAGEKEIIDGIESDYTTYLTKFSTLRSSSEGSTAGAYATYEQLMRPSYESVRSACTRLREINQNTMFEASASAERAARRAFVSTLGVGAAALLVGLGYSYLLSQRLVRPLLQMRSATQAIAEGDYEVTIPAGGADELGHVADGFNVMARQLALYHRMNVDKILAEQRKADAVLRSIEDGIVVVDAELRVTNINRAAERILRVDEDQASGRHVLELVRDERLFAYVRQAAEEGVAPRLDDDRAILTAGRESAQRHYLFSVTPVQSTDGSRQGAVLVMRDVTHLQEVSRLKTEFVMTASHELRTPLHSILMSLNLVKEKTGQALPAQAAELIETSIEETNRLSALVNDLLDLSKLEAGKISMDVQPVSIRLLVEKAVAVFDEQTAARHVALSADVPEGLPPVRADANKLVWVLTNLISNALRYVPDGGHIDVKAERAGQWVHTSVTDDGPGIPPELQPRVFEKFVQAEGPASVGGTGLGLAICREIVRAHKGTIWLDSREGEGASFTFALPAEGRQEREQSDADTTDTGG